MVFRFRTVLLLVARQNGKTAFLIYLILWRMFQDGARTTIGTAQSIDTAEEAWSAVVAIAEAIPELADDIAKVREGKGGQLLRLDSGERYKIAAANRRGGRGLSGDFVVLDELRGHQTWDSWSAVSKTTLARERAQVWGVSNAGDMASIVLRHLHKAALAYIKGEAFDAGDDDDHEIDESSIGLFEWSAHESRGIRDREGWAEANPSMGYTGLTEHTIASQLSDPEWIFRTEVLCQFVNTVGAGPFPNGSWAKTMVPKVVRDVNRPAVYGIDMSHDRTWVHIALAFWDTGGRRRVEMVASRPGPDWVIPWLLSPERKVAPTYVTLQTNGAPISSLVDAFGAEDVPIELTPWAGPDLSRWCGVFYDGIRKSMDDEGAEVTLTHGVHPVLDIAANSARIKTSCDGWFIDRKLSPEDAAPLMAAIGAVGLLSTNPAPPAKSAYEDYDLMVV